MVNENEKWLVMESGNAGFYTLVNTGDVDENQIFARCKTEADAEYIVSATDYYSAHIEALQDKTFISSENFMG